MQQVENDPAANRLKKQAVTASVGLSILLCLLKITATFYTGSLAILSSLIDSCADVFASSISFIAVRFSTKAATCTHRYGFGRAESISALLQSAFIAGSGFFVMYDGIQRLIHPLPLQKTLLGIVIMVISLALTIALIIFQKYVTKRTGSPAIDADSAHYTVDVLTNLSIIFSLIMVKIFHIGWFDAATAFVISLYLIYNAYRIASRAMADLTDQELADSVRMKVIDIVINSDGIMGYHDFRTRNLGSAYFFEIHLELDGNLPLAKAHDLTDAVENKIKAVFPGAQVIIHQDPYGLRENRLDYTIDGHCKL